MSTATQPITQHQMYANPALWDVTIVSISPFPLGPYRMESHPGFKDYTMPAAERGEYSTMQVTPRIIHIRDMTSVDEENPTPGIRPIQQDAMQVAVAIESKWADTTLGNAGRLGVGILPPGAFLPGEGEKPSGEFLQFLAKLKADQESLARDAVKQASDWEANGKRLYITEFHRTLAIWLYGKNANKIKWVENPGYSEMKRCFCAQDIPLEATVCPVCRVDLPMKHIERGTRPADDPYVMEAITEILAARGQQPSANVSHDVAMSSVEPEPIEFKEPSAAEVAAQKAIADRLALIEKKSKQ